MKVETIKVVCKATKGNKKGYKVINAADKKSSHKIYKPKD